METKQSVEIGEKEVANIRHWLRAYDAALDDNEKGVKEVLSIAAILVALIRGAVRESK